MNHLTPSLVLFVSVLFNGMLSTKSGTSVSHLGSNFTYDFIEMQADCQ